MAWRLHGCMADGWNGDRLPGAGAAEGGARAACGRMGSSSFYSLLSGITGSADRWR